jgi:type I restriction enzyme S subunit
MNQERLKHVADVRVSNVDKKSTEGDPQVRLCNYTDVYYNERITRACNFMEATATDGQQATFGLRQGDVVLTKDSETADDIGVSAFVAEDVPDLVCGYHLAMVRAHDGYALGGYLRWVLSSALSRQRMSAEATGVTRFGLRSEAIGNLLVPVPRLTTQRAIADFLDGETARIDALIAAKQRMVMLLAEHRESSAADLVERAKDLGSSVPLWTVMRPDETTGAPDLEVLSVYRDHGVIPKSSRSDNYNKTPEDLSRYQVVRPGDIVVNKMKAWQGSIGVSKFHGIVSPDYLVCRLLRPLDPSFLHHVLRSPQLRVEYLSRSEGIRPAQWRLQWDQMRLIELPVPDESAQAAIVAAHSEGVARSQELVSSLVRQIELLQERRQTVITDAVTGNIHIPGSA